MDNGEKRKTKKKEKRKEDKWQVRRRGGKGKEASHLEQNWWERRKKRGKKERKERGRKNRRSDSRSSTVRELKLVQATRATHGY